MTLLLRARSSSRIAATPVGLLMAALEQASLELEGWQPQAPLRISDDGRFAFGYALCGGQMTPYRWQLPR